MRDGVAKSILTKSEGLIGLALIVAMALAAIFAFVIFPNDPLSLAGRPLTPPFTRPGFWLGTDRLGRDVMAGIVHGARTSMVTALAVLAIAATIGATVGTVAGYFGGWLDEALMRIADAVQTVPSLVVALAVVSIAGPGAWGVIGALAASAWTGPARVTRAQVMAVKASPYVEASRLTARRPLAIAFDVVLPNAVGPLVALSGVIVANAVIMEAALAFLGLSDPNLASWGAMIADGRQVLRTAPWLAIAPGVAIILLVLGVNLVAGALTAALAAERE